MQIDASWSDSNTAFDYRQTQQPPGGDAPAAVFTNVRAYRHNLGDQQWTNSVDGFSLEG